MINKIKCQPIIFVTDSFHYDNFQPKPQHIKSQYLTKFRTADLVVNLSKQGKITFIRGDKTLFKLHYSFKTTT